MLSISQGLVRTGDLPRKRISQGGIEELRKRSIVFYIQFAEQAQYVVEKELQYQSL